MYAFWWHGMARSKQHALQLNEHMCRKDMYPRLLSGDENALVWRVLTQIFFFKFEQKYENAINCREFTCTKKINCGRFIFLFTAVYRHAIILNAFFLSFGLFGHCHWMLNENIIRRKKKTIVSNPMYYGQLMY